MGWRNGGAAASDQQPVQQYGPRSSQNFLSPASAFPPEDFVNGFKNQYEALPVSPILTEAYGWRPRSWPPKRFGEAIFMA
jgi:hypothetical protein